MIQALLVLFGLYCLITGKLKISSKKEIRRPNSTYFGLMFIAYAIGINYLPMEPAYLVPFYGSLVLFSALLVAKSETVELPSEEGEKKSKETLRNVGLLIAFIVLIIAVFYFSFLY